MRLHRSQAWKVPDGTVATSLRRDQRAATVSVSNRESPCSSARSGTQRARAEAFPRVLLVAASPRAAVGVSRLAERPVGLGLDAPGAAGTLVQRGGRCTLLAKERVFMEVP